jgi:hypothetical protein
MTKIVLTAAAILVATGTAFAGSDNYGSNNQPAAIVDTSYTASIQMSDTVVQKPVTQGSDQNLFGNR